MGTQTPKGWTIDPKRPERPYKAQLTVNKEVKYLGHFKTEEAAHEAYIKARAETPALPHMGGAKIGTYTPPRKVCPNCEKPYAVTKFDIHYKACKRDYPYGYKSWMLAPKAKRRKGLKDIMKDNEELKEQNAALKAQLEAFAPLVDEYTKLLALMEQARKESIESEIEQRPRFKMDENGNLTRIDK